MPARDMAVPSDLDKLLTAYLHALDRYMQLREELARFYSDGFLSLARARFRSSPAAMHFGIGSASFEGRSRNARLRCEVVKQQHEHTPGVVEPPSSGKFSDADTQLELHVRVIPPPARKSSTDVNAEVGVEPEKEHAKKQDDASADSDSLTAPDPLRLFGILPPPALRETQAEFEHAVCGPTAELVGVMAHMTRLEGLIEEEKARRQEG